MWPCPFNNTIGPDDETFDRIVGAAKLYHHWCSTLHLRPVGDWSLGTTFIGRRGRFPFAPIDEPIPSFVIPKTWVRRMRSRRFSNAKTPSTFANAQIKTFRAKRCTEFTSLGLRLPAGFTPIQNKRAAPEPTRTIKVKVKRSKTNRATEAPTHPEVSLEEMEANVLDDVLTNAVLNNWLSGP